MNSINLKAYAKVNLALDIIGKRPDGYHDVSMIMQTIALHDKIKITINNENKINIKTNLYYLPSNSNNIVYKATELFFSQLNLKSGVNIDILKQIPVSAGLGGGSADAAATFIGLNKLFRQNLSTSELMALGVKIGADVPFCILKGTALSEGIGEILSPLNPMPDGYFVIVKPPISVSTKEVYENLNLHTNYTRPDIDLIIQHINNNNITRLASSMANILESVTESKHQIIKEIKEELLRHNALGSIMSGSGPSVFGVFENEQGAKNAFLKLKEKYHNFEIFISKPYFNKPLT